MIDFCRAKLLVAPGNSDNLAHVRMLTHERGYLCGTPERFLLKAPKYMTLIAVRQKHSEANRTAHNPAFWTKLGDVVAKASLLVSTMLLQDVLAKRCNEHAMRVQQVHVLPEAKLKSHQQLLESLVSTKRLLLEIVDMLCLVQFLSGYLPPARVKLFYKVWFAHKVYRQCPTLVRHLPELIRALDF